MTLHLFPDVEQRSDEWHEQRRGIVTASAVGKLLTPTLKVADNDTSRGLTLTLAAERISGETENGPLASDMIRGIEMEPFARDKYAEHHAPVVEFGFMVRKEDGWQLGYSPDGIVGDNGSVGIVGNDNGLIEIKCPRAKQHVSTILADAVPAQYMPQLQAALLVSGRKWIDYVSFVGGLPLFVKRVEPDPAWFAAITAACVAFETNVAAIVADYEQRVVGLPATERIDFEIKVA